MITLPGTLPKTEWVDVDATTHDNLRREFERCVTGPGWNPKTVQISGNLYAIDFCSTGPSGEFGSYETAVFEDHEFLKVLEGFLHVPRAVKAPYLRTNRIKYIRATEAWEYLSDMRRASDAWDKYWPNAIKKEIDNDC